VTYIDRKSTRVTAESAYLTDDVLARPNLTVVTHARVTKVLFDTSSSIPRAIGVEFSSKSDMGVVGPKFHARATKEVIVSYANLICLRPLLTSSLAAAPYTLRTS
jgi:choline dehydrogenase